MAEDPTKTGESVVAAKKPNPWLIVIGVILVAACAYSLIYARNNGSETKEVTSAPPATSTTPSVTTKTTTAKSVPSDTVLTTVFGAGAVLILIGAFYGRLSSIKILGAELTMTEDETNKAAEQAVKELGDKPTKEAARDLPKVMDKVREEKRSKGVVELSDRELKATVTRAVEELD